MNKKGQVYLLAALILSLVLYNLASVVNFAHFESFKADFERVSDNYNVESTRLVNSVLKTEQEPFDALSNFTVLYMSYVKSQSPNFGLIYVFNREGKMRIGNYLKKPVIIDTTGNYDISRLGGCYEKISARIDFKGLKIDLPIVDLQDLENCYQDFAYTNVIYIALEDVDEYGVSKTYWYPFSISEGGVELMVVNQLEEGNQRKVSVSGELVIGEVRKTLEELREECNKGIRQKDCGAL